MTLFILSDTNEKLTPFVKYAASSWADIILMGLNEGKKPEILIDRSGSMSSTHTTIDHRNITRMDISRGIVVMVANILSKRNKGFDLTQIPVKSWGSNLYSHGTLDDFLPANFINNNPPFIPATDGTDHGFWYNESDYPLVITDDFFIPDVPPPFAQVKGFDKEFIKNYRNFAWCDGDNIIVMDNKSHRERVNAVHQKILDGQ